MYGRQYHTYQLYFTVSASFDYASDTCISIRVNVLFKLTSSTTVMSTA